MQRPAACGKRARYMLAACGIDLLLEWGSFRVPLPLLQRLRGAPCPRLQPSA